MHVRAHLRVELDTRVGAVRLGEDRERHHRLPLEAVAANGPAVGVDADRRDEVVGGDDARVARDGPQRHVLFGERAHERRPGGIVPRVDLGMVWRRREGRDVESGAGTDQEGDRHEGRSPTCGDRSHDRPR